MIYDENDRLSELLSGEREVNTPSDAKAELLALFDEGTFSEFSAHRTSQNGSDKTGVITGYGAVDGALVFAFAQDLSRRSGALELSHAEKIEELYRLAKKAGAPVIGIFDSEGVDVEGGVSALSAYGRILSAVAAASGKIPQIALLLGTCRGISSVIAGMFDFIVKEPSGVFGTTGTDKEPLYAYTASSRFGGVTFIHDLLSYLPRNARVGVLPYESADSLNRRLSAALTPEHTRELLTATADNTMSVEVFAYPDEEIITEFAVCGGIPCGIFANVPTKGQGRLSETGIKKLSAFIRFCNRFRMPIVSLIHSAGLSEEEPHASLALPTATMAELYITAKVPKVAVILGKAIGAAAVLFGSHSMGCDIVYALETAEIAALPTASAVAFAWNERITEETTRRQLEKKWLSEKASAAAAAAVGEVDDIITLPELRKRVTSALLMLTADGTAEGRGD